MEHHFFAYVSRMRYIQRWGLMKNTSAENDMEHSFQTAMTAHAIALIGNSRYGRSYDAEHVMAMALYHDACEVLTGDMPTPVKHNNPALRAEYGRLEDEAAERLLSMLPPDVKEDYRPLIRQDEASAEWAVVKAADRIAAWIKCTEEKRAGNHEFDYAAENVRNSLKAEELPEVQDFIREYLPAYELTLDELNHPAGEQK